jgi:hypothetical protein
MLLRTSFLLLALVVVLMTVTVLQEEKQRSFNNYQAGLEKTKEQIVARLHHPSGQLALLNPAGMPLRIGGRTAVVLPSRASISTTRTRSQRHRDGRLPGPLPRPWQPLRRHRQQPLGRRLHLRRRHLRQRAAACPPHRRRSTSTARIGCASRSACAAIRPGAGSLPSKRSGAAAVAGEGVRGRFTGYRRTPGRNYTGARPQREFRGWVWQRGRCLDVAGRSRELPAQVLLLAAPADRKPARRLFLQPGKPTWPPPDLDQYRVQVEVLPPGDGPPRFDSDQAGREPPPFALDDLAPSAARVKP